jgi:hypothetical protein
VYWFVENFQYIVCLSYTCAISNTNAQLADAVAATCKNRYERKKQDAESAKYGARWQALFMFQQMHEADRPAGARPVRLVGSDNAVYERLYRAEPRKVRHSSLARHSSVHDCALHGSVCDLYC